MGKFYSRNYYYRFTSTTRQYWRLRNDRINNGRKMSKYLNCTNVTLRRYLFRAEFSHIERIKLAGNNYILKNITDRDKEKLKQLIGRKQNQRKS